MAGWPQGNAWEGFVARWQDACADDAVLAEWRQGAETRFAIVSGGARAEFGFGQARGPAAFALEASPEIWAKHLEPIPPRHHHAIFAMRHRVPGFAVTVLMTRRCVQSLTKVRTTCAMVATSASLKRVFCMSSSGAPNTLRSRA